MGEIMAFNRKWVVVVVGLSFLAGMLPPAFAKDKPAAAVPVDYSQRIAELMAKRSELVQRQKELDAARDKNQREFWMVTGALAQLQGMQDDGAPKDAAPVKS